MRRCGINKDQWVGFLYIHIFILSILFVYSEQALSNDYGSCINFKQMTVACCTGAAGCQPSALSSTAQQGLNGFCAQEKAAANQAVDKNSNFIQQCQRLVNQCKRVCQTASDNHQKNANGMQEPGKTTELGYKQISDQHKSLCEKETLQQRIEVIRALDHQASASIGSQICENNALQNPHTDNNTNDDIAKLLAAQQLADLAKGLGQGQGSQGESETPSDGQGDSFGQPTNESLDQLSVNTPTLNDPSNCKSALAHQLPSCQTQAKEICESDPSSVACQNLVKFLCEGSGNLRDEKCMDVVDFGCRGAVNYNGEPNPICESHEKLKDCESQTNPTPECVQLISENGGAVEPAGPTDVESEYENGGITPFGGGGGSGSQGTFSMTAPPTQFDGDGSAETGTKEPFKVTQMKVSSGGGGGTPFKPLSMGDQSDPLNDYLNSLKKKVAPKSRTPAEASVFQAQTQIAPADGPSTFDRIHKIMGKKCQSGELMGCE